MQLFLVLSGFCIHMRWSRCGDLAVGVDFLSFWKRRLLRLYPPYFIALLCTLFAAFVFHGVLRTPSSPGFAGYFGYSDGTTFAIDLTLLLLLMQNLNKAPWRVGNGPFWSLALEEQLYLLYFPLLTIRRKWGWGLTLAVAGGVTVVWRGLGVALFDKPPAFWFVVGPAFWLAWTLGALAVEDYHGHVQLPRWVRSPFLLAVLLVLAVLTDFPAGYGIERTWFSRFANDILFCGAFFCLVHMVATAEKNGANFSSVIGRALAATGVWSYSIYLVHLVPMVAAKQVLVALGLPPIVILVLRGLIGVTLGYVFYRVVERYFHVRSRRIAVK